MSKVEKGWEREEEQNANNQTMHYHLHTRFSKKGMCKIMQESVEIRILT